jgi:hypothetical protein
MTNKEKLIAIIGEENFRKLERNFNPKFKKLKSIDECINCHNEHTIAFAFDWTNSPERWWFWSYLDDKLMGEWEDVLLRKITNEEHDLLFKMFCMEWMEYPQGDNERWYETVFSEGVGLKVYEALRSE